jgi:hypothetical protein
MKKTMFSIARVGKVALVGVMVAAAALMQSSCNKEQPVDNPTGKDDKTATSPLEVRLSGTLPGISTTGYYFELLGRSFAIGADGTFDFTLPTPAADELLRPELITSAELMSITTITPSDVKVFAIADIAVLKDGQPAGEVRNIKTSPSFEHHLVYYYADKDAVIHLNTVNIDGKTMKANLNLKAGWNIAAVIEKQEGEGYSFTITTDDIPTDVAWEFTTVIPAYSLVNTVWHATFTWSSSEGDTIRDIGATLRFITTTEVVLHSAYSNGNPFLGEEATYTYNASSHEITINSNLLGSITGTVGSNTMVLSNDIVGTQTFTKQEE